MISRRDRDRAELARRVGLPEAGGRQRFELDDGTLFATAYQRVVFGDRGPYVEFQREEIAVPLASRFNNDPSTLPPEDCGYFYLWLHPAGHPAVKVYWQIKTVSYADYRRGLYYVDPYQLSAPGCAPAQRSLFGT